MKLRKLAAVSMAAAVMATMSMTAFAEADETTAEVAETTVAEEAPAEEVADEAPAGPEWVGVTTGGTAELNKWISFDKLGGALNKPCLLLCSEDDKAEPPADSELSFKVSDIYGFVIYAEFDKTAWNNWHGGQIGTNSALGGWNAFIDYSTGNDVPGLDIDIDAGTITYFGDTALFAQDEQDKGGYAHIWLMDWSNGDDAVKVCGMDILDENGDVITFDAPAAEEEEEDSPATGDVDAATDSSKGSPDTGVADVAVVAGLGLLAAGAVIVAKKRK